MANLIGDSGRKANRIEELSKESNESDLIANGTGKELVASISLESDRTVAKPTIHARLSRDVSRVLVLNPPPCDMNS
jgi:hypothetical protein